jgi:hypothetical protein
MKYLLISAALICASCSISPVISDPASSRGERYSDCRRVARDYCRDVEQVSDADQKRCVSEATYKCVSGSGG